MMNWKDTISWWGLIGLVRTSILVGSLEAVTSDHTAIDSLILSYPAAL
jgi:hypothetical protein